MITTRTDPVTAADVLRSAAEAFRTGAITWGQEWFHSTLTGCRCALGAITYALDPEDDDGNPYSTNPIIRPVAEEAATTLADYLVNELDAARCHTDGAWDTVETVGAWNDEHGRTVADVIAALEAAADYYPAAVTA